ncbi:LOW QUALITY PROTEIN: hypothetical protein JCM24511_02194 [Saitozyma sp. JCM 24511]|nr:LOW QUALITY PROTEIN: hypothetical protein JCM24511_02194 [Saitozyma sp. JCM 24511]
MSQTTLEGRCNCGAIVLTIAAPFLPCNKTEYTLTGSPKLYNELGDSGKPVERGFCGDCGSSLWYADGIKPHQIYFHGGKCHAAASGVTQAFAHHQNIHALSSLPPRPFHLVPSTSSLPSRPFHLVDLVPSTSSLPPRPNLSRPKNTTFVTHVLRSLLLSNLPGDPAQTLPRAIQPKLFLARSSSNSSSRDPAQLLLARSSSDSSSSALPHPPLTPPRLFDPQTIPAPTHELFTRNMEVWEKSYDGEGVFSEKGQRL